MRRVNILLQSTNTVKRILHDPWSHTTVDQQSVSFAAASHVELLF